MNRQVLTGTRAWPFGDSEMAVRIRDHDWARTPLGPIERWPQTLKTAVDIVLASPVPMSVVWGAPQTLIYNDGMTSQLGVKHPHALGRSFGEAWPEAEDVMRGVLAGKPSRFEDQAFPIERDGASRDAYFSGSWVPVRDETGAIAGAVMTNVDTTRRAMLAHEKGYLGAALIESQERLSMALESAGLGLWQWDPASDHAVGDSRMLSILGQKPGADLSLRKALQSFIHPDDHDRVNESLRRSLDPQGPGRVDSEFRYLRPGDGCLAWVRFAGMTRFEGQGAERRAVLCVGTVSDITERKQAEADLRASERKFRQISESGMLSIAFFNMTGEITDANDAFLNLIGYDRADLTGGRIRWDDLTPPEWKARTEAAFEEYRRAGRIVPYAKEYFRKDGSRFWALFGGALVDSEHGVMYVLDIAEQKRAEQANQILIAELKHRTRNLLSVVQSISLQTRKTSTSLDEYSAKFLERLFALARIQEPLTASDFPRVTVRQLLELELGALGDQAARDRVSLDGPDVVVPSGAVQMMALGIHELATNALKHGALVPAQAGARLSIRWHVRRSASGSGQEFVLDWRETGVAGLRRSRRVGFGKTLIERLLPAQVGGTSTFELTKDGAHFALTVPLDAASGLTP